MAAFTQLLGVLLFAGAATAYAQPAPVRVFPVAAEPVIAQAVTDVGPRAVLYAPLRERGTTPSLGRPRVLEFVVLGAAIGAFGLLMLRGSHCDGADTCEPGTGTTVLIGAIGGGMAGGLIGLIVGGGDSRIRSSPVYRRSCPGC